MRNDALVSTFPDSEQSTLALHKKVPSVVFGAEFYTKSELGAIATSRTLNFPEVGAPVWVVIS